MKCFSVVCVSGIYLAINEFYEPVLNRLVIYVVVSVCAYEFLKRFPRTVEKAGRQVERVALWERRQPPKRTRHMLCNFRNTKRNKIKSMTGVFDGEEYSDD